MWRFEDEIAPATAAAANTDEATLQAAMEQASIAATDASSSASSAAADSATDSFQGDPGRFLPPTPLDPNSPLLPYYLLDGASMLAVEALQVQPHHVVLDLCAAPGGKSVCIAQYLDLMQVGVATPAVVPSGPGSLALATPHSLLHANEPQGTRRLRLQGVLDEYIPPTVRKNRARIEVTPWDATKVALPQSKYDRVLVDAPCSSDRHVLQSAKELAAWTPKRIKLNAERQHLLLLNALRATKPGGICVYATCSLSRKENDEVVESVLAKLARNAKNGAASQRIRVQVLPIQITGSAPAVIPASDAAGAAVVASSSSDVLYLPMGEPTKFGWMVLPDQVEANIEPAAAAPVAAPNSEASAPAAAAAAAATAATASSVAAPRVGHGFGPLYFCRLRRLAHDDASGGDHSDSVEESSNDDSEAELEPKRKPDLQLPAEEAEE